MDNAKKTILIIEDNKQLSKAYHDGLKRKGFNIIRAFNGEEGYSAAKNEKPDLIMLDLILPDIPGETVLKKMNESGLIKEVPVIVLTNKIDSADMHNCMDVLGAADFMIKSDYTIEGIARKINNVLQKKALGK